MWKDKVDFKGLSYSKNHVHGVFYSRIVERDFFFTRVYGPPDVSNRPSFWSLIKSLQKQDFSWVVIGGFNELLVPLEKLGGQDRLDKQMGDFKEALSDCNLYDLGFSGVLFTWCNNREGDQRILKSLDHAIENDAWTSLFSNVGVIHGCVAYLDHCPI